MKKIEKMTPERLQMIGARVVEIMLKISQDAENFRRIHGDEEFDKIVAQKIKEVLESQK